MCGIHQMRLSDVVLSVIKKAGVKAYFADRRITSVWNGDRMDGEPVFYGGWYWNRTVKGRVTQTDEEGPFRSESAALRDAWQKLQLR